jgi:murein L,D-transpeptidase YafK
MKIDAIHVIKHERKMHLKKENSILKTYTISLGKVPIGAKEFEGDGKTPEGTYSIYHKSSTSEYFKSLGISYPNEHDKAHAEKNNKLAGGQIRIHGYKNDFMGDQQMAKAQDWTAGCIAITNEEMDELYDWIEVGTTIIIEA